MTKRIEKNRVFDSTLVAASATSTDRVGSTINMAQYGVDGSFAAQITVSGSGTATIGFKCSTDDDINFYTPSASTAISTALTIGAGLTATGSPSSDGNYYIPITNIPLCKEMSFYITETGTSNTVTVTMDFCFQ